MTTLLRYARSWGHWVAVWVLLAGVGLWVGARSVERAAIAGPGDERAETPGTLGSGAMGPVKWGSAVYPQQELPLKFSHKKHLAKGMACTDCHTQVETSRKSADNNFPSAEVCDSCHTAQHPRPVDVPEKCAMCHPGAENEVIPASVWAPASKLVFSHALHLQGDETCESCHGDMSKVRLATVHQLPSEASCLTCHDGVKATQRCSSCHPSGADGKLITRDIDDPAAAPLIPRDASGWGAEHDLAFVQDHGGISKANPRLCESCHEHDDCLDCHAGVLRPMRIHNADYLSTHALDARSKTQDCGTCHRMQSDCIACHERTGVGQGEDSAFGVGSSLRFHPDDWVGGVGELQGHVRPAQRNINACASCHDEDACLSCHATTDVAQPGLNVSPHGPEFASSARCQLLANRNRRVCLKCHAPTDPQIECQ